MHAAHSPLFSLISRTALWLSRSKVTIQMKNSKSGLAVSPHITGEWLNSKTLHRPS